MNIPKFVIGMDIGGTNTDAVLIDDQKAVVAAIKVPTTEDVGIGFTEALKGLLITSSLPPFAVSRLSLGTTHATNAILQRRDLYRVGVLRLAGHYPDALPSCYDWPADLRTAVYVGTETVGGGYECHGASITPLDKEEVIAAIKRLLLLGAESIAVVGCFSPLVPDQEYEVLRLVQTMISESLPITLSCKVGGIGFIERENTSVLNAALKKVMAYGFSALEQTCRQMGLVAPLALTQNNGSLISLAQAIDYPVLTMSAGPTNSFVGAARLAGLTDAVVVDIGGTSTDIGFVRAGFPRRSLTTSQIGGVSLNLAMPDVLSVALGGGSIVNVEAGALCISATSVARLLTERAQVFGGDTLTLTDLAVVSGTVIAGADPARVSISLALANEALERVVKRIDDEISRFDLHQHEKNIVFVGGGAALLPKSTLGAGRSLPSHAHVANAYGAALAEMSAVVDRVVSLTDREETLRQLEEEALLLARQKGASLVETRIIERHIVPYHYVPNQMARVVITAAGPLI